MRGSWRATVYLVLGLLLTAGSCSRPAKTAAPLAPISPLPAPTVPPWIVDFAPKDEAESLSQIRVRFANDLIPLQSLEGPGEAETLGHFSIDPPLAGHFRFLTPRMIGFQADGALPLATRVKVVVHSGLHDRAQHTLDHDLAWTFTTAPLSFTNVPGSEDGNGQKEVDVSPSVLTPSFTINANAEVDLASLQAATVLRSEDGKSSISVDVTAKYPQDSETQSPSEKFDPSQRCYCYVLKPRSALAKATRYHLTIASGVKPASGNLPTTHQFIGRVETFAPFALSGSKQVNAPSGGGADGRFANGVPEIDFNNGVVLKSLDGHVTLQPPAKDISKLFVASDGDAQLTLNPGMLSPGVAYTLTFAPGVKDVFDQTLTQAATVTFRTGDDAGRFWAPGGFNIFPADSNIALALAATNIPSGEYDAIYHVVQPVDLINGDPRNIGDSNDKLFGGASWTPHTFAQKKNVASEIDVPLRDLLGGRTGMLAYGVSSQAYQFVDSSDQKRKWYEPAYYGVVQLTNLGVFAQIFPASALVRVHHLSDGSPAQTRVDVFRSALNANDPVSRQPCASGATDASGTLTLDRGSVAACYTLKSDSADAPALLVVATEAKDWAFVRCEGWSGAWGYGVDAAWPSSGPQARGALFSDRELYQPGEQIALTGIAYALEDGKLHPEHAQPYALTLVAPSGGERTLGTVNTNDHSTFTYSMRLRAAQELGYYTVRAKGADGSTLSGSFRVAEFKPPNFKVELKVDKPFAAIGDPVNATSTSTYLFGAPVQGGKTHYYITRTQTDFTPKGWDTYIFGRHWIWPEETPSVQSDVLQRDVTLDPAGKASQAVTVASDLPYPMTYNVSAETVDVSNLSVADAKSFTALPSADQIGVQSDFVGQAGKPLAIKVIVTDPLGTATAGRAVHLELQSRTLTYAGQIVEGSEQDKYSATYATVASADVTSGGAPSSVMLTPPKGGSYRIRATIGDAARPASETDAEVWVSGEGEAFWGSDDKSVLQIKLDKASYEPGATATAVIQSPYDEAELYLAVIRNGTIWKHMQLVHGSAPRISFTVTPEMLPNAALQAVLVRRGAPIAQQKPDTPDSLVRIGFVPFATSITSKYLGVHITPAQASLEPGARQTVALEASDAAHHGHPAQFTVIVANDAVLQLTGYRLPDLAREVYGQQGVYTRFADNRPNVIYPRLKINAALPKGWGYGGGFLAGAGSTRIRTDFRALAYYAATIASDSSGHASVSFALPDDLTTWRVMAVAVAEQAAPFDVHFGTADATFITTKPLLTNPVLPQFARPGDHFQGGEAITNPTGATGSLAIAADLLGDLRFDGTDAATHRTADVPATSGTQAFRLPMVVSGGGSARVRFTTKMNGGAQASDGFEVPLPVRTTDVSESVIATGTADATAHVPLNLTGENGELTISIGSSLVPELVSAGRAMLERERCPFAEPIASELVVVSDLQVLAKRYALNPFGARDPAALARDDLRALTKLQVDDGGFSIWPGGKTSSPEISPLVAEALASARAAGFGVDAGLLTSVRGYLEKLLNDPAGMYSYCTAEPCKSRYRLGALIALTRLGDVSTQHLSDIYAQRASFDLVTQIELARFLHQAGWQTQSDEIAAPILSLLYQTGRYATLNLRNGYAWLASASAAQAQMLRLLMERKADATTRDSVLRSLIALRRNGAWPTSYDNAQALDALIGIDAGAPPSFDASVTLGGSEVASASFHDLRSPMHEVVLRGAKLPNGTQDLVLAKHGSGTLHYLVTYRYHRTGSSPGVLAGLRVTRELRGANQPDVLASMGLALPAAPVQLAPGAVFDVGLTIITDHPVNQVVITDPIPAGMEAVDTSFLTATPYFQARGDDWQIDYQTIYRDRIVAYADRLEAGIYAMHYLVRSVTPGTFAWPGPSAQLLYAPEEFGRGASGSLILRADK